MIVDAKPEPRYKATPNEWAEIRRSFHGARCQSCGNAWHPDRDHLHHLVHRSQRGSDVHENLAPLCQRCHVLIHEYDRGARGRLAASLTAAQRTYVVRVKGAWWLDRFFPGWRDGES